MEKILKRKWIRVILCAFVPLCLCASPLFSIGTFSGTVVSNVKDYGGLYLPSYYRATKLGELIVFWTNSLGKTNVQNGKYYILNSMLMTNTTTFTVSSGYDLSSIPPSYSANGRIGYYIDYVYIITNRANVSDNFNIRISPLATDDLNWTGNLFSLWANSINMANNQNNINTTINNISADEMLTLRIRLNIPLSVARGSTNLFLFEIWNSIWNTNTSTGDQWPGSGAIDPATPDLVDGRDYQRSFIKTTSYGIYHAVMVLSADDMIHTITKLDGTEYLGTTRVKINILLDSPPIDPANVYLIYNINKQPTGSNPDDRRVKLEGGGINYYALILAKDDNRIISGAEFNFIIQCDNEIYYRDGQSGFEPWSFKFKTITMQKNEVSILNNLLNPRKSESTIIFYGLQEPSHVQIEVYTLAGEKISTLFDGWQDIGYQKPIYWYGKNEFGQEVSEGLYFISFRAKGINEIRKVVVVK